MLIGVSNCEPQLTGIISSGQKPYNDVFSVPCLFLPFCLEYVCLASSTMAYCILFSIKALTSLLNAIMGGKKKHLITVEWSACLL